MGCQGGSRPPGVTGLIILLLLMVAVFAVGFWFSDKREYDQAKGPGIYHRVELMEEGKPVRAWRARGYVRPVDAGMTEAGHHPG